MRSHLSLTITLLLVVAGAAVTGFAAAGASTSATRPHVVINMVPMASCTPSTLYCFKPSNKTVVKGTKVTWKNASIAPHTVTRCTAAACSGVSGGTGTDTTFGSPGTIASGGKYSFVFKGVGTYVYYCQVHGYAVMHGTITVTN
jgi:plastocyanin